MPSLFLGYASKPELTRETLYHAGREIEGTAWVEVVAWEDLRIAGRIIVRQILDAIDGAAACGFDVSTSNQNVLFELGYAIACAKPIWLLLDQSDTEAKAIGAPNRCRSSATGFGAEAVTLSDTLELPIDSAVDTTRSASRSGARSRGRRDPR